MSKLDSMKTLEALVAEKRKLEGFIEKMEARRGTTPEHVFKKLHDEYHEKLLKVSLEAQTEAERIEGSFEADEQAIAALEEKLSVLNEEKVEGELRADVGELDTKEWNKKLTALNASIATAERERDHKVTALERARATIAEAMGTRPSGSSKPATGSASSGKSNNTATKSAVQGDPQFNDLAFLNTVARTSSPGAPAPRTSKPVDALKDSDAETAPIKEGPSGKPIKEPSSGPKKVAAPAPAAPAAPAAAAPKAAKPDSEDEEPVTDSFGRATPRTSQAVKTLKCQECGTFNFPTEWYCERCGGELAAL